MNKMILKASVAAAILAVSGGAAQAEWPEEAVRLVISFSPGGGMDQSVLPLKPLLEEDLGQTFLYDYRPGASGRIGFEYVYMNGEDGYTVSALSEPHFTNTTIFDEPRYTIEDLVPVGLFMRDVPVWFVRNDSPYQDMNDLIEAAREMPGEITVATGSFTGEQYLTVAILEEQADVQFRAVNVQGGAPVMSNVLGGHMDVGVSRPASIAGIADEVRALGVVSPERNNIFPDAPTFDEQLPEEYDIPHFSSSRGFAVHRQFAEENPEGFARLEQALHDAVHSDAYGEALDRMGLDLEWVPSEAAQEEILATARMMEQYRELVVAAQDR
ncbi:tripartite tricarboxylate transporter substrate binding protein [Fodinicurvata sp. EGI_FJ10296]|uniref:Bug family tripartite tricarboxylate transporter substrate binding protein n=1 Tax=Fodinicurvata sp. EGI_FJ10296 TaxID=3231908 RepID=UPI003454C743